MLEDFLRNIQTSGKGYRIHFARAAVPQNPLAPAESLERAKILVQLSSAIKHDRDLRVKASSGVLNPGILLPLIAILFAALATALTSMEIQEITGDATVSTSESDSTDTEVGDARKTCVMQRMECVESCQRKWPSSRELREYRQCRNLCWSDYYECIGNI